MQYFTEQGRTHLEVMDKIRLKYGDRAKILTQKSIPLGGFLGFFQKEGIEITGYLSNDAGRKRRLDLSEEKRKLLENVKNDNTLEQVLKEVKTIKEKLDSEYPQVQVQDNHSTIKKIAEMLANNDFSFPYIDEISKRIKREFSISELENFNLVQDSVVTWICDSIEIYEPREAAKPEIFIIVGPTGVGKTTTIAKLAAIYGISNPQSKTVRMITIDNYRIGARKQIETYGEIMGIPVSCVENYQDLSKQIALYNDVDLILVDTIGKSPKDYMKLAEMRELLDACGHSSQIHLAISASTKQTDIREIFHQFEPFKYRSVILTKLDETNHVGNIISALAERKKSISFITDGQVVPQDIDFASVEKLLSCLDQFNIDHEKIKNRFSKNRKTLYKNRSAGEWS